MSAPNGVQRAERETELMGKVRADASRNLNTERKPSPILNPRFECEACRTPKRFGAEYFAQVGTPYHFALCPHCWRKLPKAVRARYARK